MEHNDDGEGMPPGHGHGMAKSPKDLPKENDANGDEKLARGTITIAVRNPDDTPIRGQEVLLGIVRNTIAEGESRKRKTALTNEEGLVTFADLEVGSAFAYRCSLTRDGAQSAVA